MCTRWLRSGRFRGSILIWLLLTCLGKERQQGLWGCYQSCGPGKQSGKLLDMGASPRWFPRMMVFKLFKSVDTALHSKFRTQAALIQPHTLGSGPGTQHCPHSTPHTGIGPCAAPYLIHVAQGSLQVQKFGSKDAVHCFSVTKLLGPWGAPWAGWHGTGSPDLGHLSRAEDLP